MAWEENSRICLNMQLIAILSRIGVIVGVGYSFRDFSNKNSSNYNGAYFSLGLRF